MSTSQLLLEIKAIVLCMCFLLKIELFQLCTRRIISKLNALKMLYIFLINRFKNAMIYTQFFLFDF